jgi:tetratricopeptide (TPR) repeat protein
MDPSNWPDQELITLLEPEQQTELLRDLSELMFLWSKSEFDEAVKQKDNDLRLASLNRAQRLLEMSRTGYVGREIPGPLNRLEKRIVEFRDHGIIEVPKSGPNLSSKIGSKETLLDSDKARENILELADLDQGVSNENLLATLAALSDQSSSNPYTWTLIGNAFASNGQIDKAIDDYGHAIALDQGLIWPRMHRGILYLEKFDYQSALRDFDQVVQRRPDLPAGWLNRALTKLGLGDPQGALEDLEQIAGLKETPTRVGFIRANCLEALGRYEEALKLREETTRITPNDELSWVARGSSRIQTDPKAALEDFKEALKLNPNSIIALQNKAFVELDHFRQLDQSIETLSELIQKNPRFVPALAGRGVLLARNGREKEAVRDAESVLLFDNSPFTRYQVACIYALLSKNRQDYQASAIKLLSQALRADPKLVKTAEKDTDLENIQHLANFRNLMDVIQKLNDPGIR